ncbi:putative ribosome-binding factor A [Cucumis melo var. makuwa]|uniref:Ribosome-binding factor A n=1 Tax=Cucumis melo var. makuwa TaxID=1194695 RepID=A0A5D3CFB6_CUCMM|nr:putative ribosome-binding factor A [Cucumis melo var. makuwa]TYK10667.1 putative ribosome-binding factor A [Cucumis melo var. makuwa]
MANSRSTPVIGGPLTSTHKQGWPRVLTALQQATVGGMGRNGATDGLQGINLAREEKKVKLQVSPLPFSTKLVVANKNNQTEQSNNETLENNLGETQIETEPVTAATPPSSSSLPPWRNYSRTYKNRRSTQRGWFRSRTRRRLTKRCLTRRRLFISPPIPFPSTCRRMSNLGFNDTTNQNIVSLKIKKG